MSKPGCNFEPLEDNDTVFLVDLVRQSSKDKVSPVVFNLTSAEKNQELKRRSAWEDELSKYTEIVDVLGNPKRRVIVELDVSDVRSINSIPDVDPDVVWDHLTNCLDSNGNPLSSGHDGCAGHSGITGWAYGVTSAKKKRKQLRRRLAKAARHIGEVRP